ncbi:MAG: LTA synthase family protein, partial [Bacilli bacterium]
MKKECSKIKKKLLAFKNNPKKYLQRALNISKEYINNNPLFISYIVICVVNATLLRYFTMHSLENIMSFKTILGDLAIVVILGSFSHLFKPKNRFLYYLVLTVIFTAICVINSAYYTFYTSFASISMISLTKFISTVGDAVVESVLQPKDLIYILGPIILIFINYNLRKKSGLPKYEGKKEAQKKTLRTLGCGLGITFVFCLTLSPVDYGRFFNQWNREYVVMKFGVYAYQINDLIQSIEPQVNSLFGYDAARKKFLDYFKEKPKEAANEYTGIYEGKNVLVIHAESLQNFVLGLTFNGVELTPNLNKLVKEGLYFSNYYSQVSVGTSSDTELTFNTSLMPSQSGTAFVNYADRKYIGMPSLFKDKGYYTFCMHGNTADFWNRRVMYENLGYERFYSKADFDVTPLNSIGLGISDKSFFEQIIPKLNDIKKQEKPFFGTLITLTNHTPFSSTEKYGPFDVSLKQEITNENGVKQTLTYPYMEDTKLGNYFKSVHYADEALGQLMKDLDANGLLENTAIVLYGDHDARLPQKDYIRFLNYDPKTNGIKDETDPTYVNFDSYQYELYRKVPLFIWTKEKEKVKEITNVMGMYDAMPTLGNMFGISNPYHLGNDIFNIKENNIVVFPTGNWITNKVYYNAQKNEYLTLSDTTIISEE